MIRVKKIALLMTVLVAIAGCTPTAQHPQKGEFVFESAFNEATQEDQLFLYREGGHKVLDRSRLGIVVLDQDHQRGLCFYQKGVDLWLAGKDHRPFRFEPGVDYGSAGTGWRATFSPKGERVAYSTFYHDKGPRAFVCDMNGGGKKIYEGCEVINWPSAGLLLRKFEHKEGDGWIKKEVFCPERE